LSVAKAEKPLEIEEGKKRNLNQTAAHCTAVLPNSHHSPAFQTRQIVEINSIKTNIIIMFLIIPGAYFSQGFS